jgi:hypothetical protein
VKIISLDEKYVEHSWKNLVCQMPALHYMLFLYGTVTAL